jgi:hypothetical protein
MLPKKTLLISAALTAFVLVMLTGVASAFKQPSQPVVVEAAALPTVTVPATEQATAIVSLTPEEAASVAAQVLNEQDLYSVESASFNGALSYKVTFSSGQLVYVSLDGQILSIDKIKPVVVVQPQTNSNSSRSSAPAQSSSSQQSEGEEHESEHDD